MWDLEREVLSDGFRTLLLCVERAPRGYAWRAEARIYDGGREVERVFLDAGEDPARAVAMLRRKLIPFCGAQRVLSAAAGRGWAQWWGEMVCSFGAAAPEALDLRAVLRALYAPLPARGSCAELLRAMGRAAPDHPPPETELWAEALWSAIHDASERGMNLTDFLGLPHAARARITPGFEHYTFDETAVRNVPAAPGVYLMRDATGKMLYIGKSDNLRRRLSEYFQATESLPEKIRSLRSRMHDLEWRVTGSEWEALLREDALIRENAPAVNVVREVEEEASRYAAPMLPVAVALPSVEPGATELLLFGPVAKKESAGVPEMAAWQIRVRWRRPPRARLAAMLRAIQGLDGGRIKPSKDWTDWGARGAEICRRYFGRRRARVHWAEWTSCDPDRLLVFLRQAALRPQDPAEWRM